MSHDDDKPMSALPREVTINGHRYVRVSSESALEDPDDLLTPEEVAALLNVSRWTVYQMLRGDEPVLPYTVPSGTRGKRVRRRDVLAHIEANRKGGSRRG